MIDPDKKTVWVYDFFSETYSVTYDFDDKIPMAVWNNEFSIDFREVYEHIRFLYKRKEETLP